MNIWETLLLVLVFGFFCYCLVRAVASMGSDKRNPNRPDGEAGLALFLSVLVLFLLVGVFFGAQSEQQPIVAEEAAEQQVPSTTEEGTTEEGTTEEDIAEEGTKQTSIEPEEPPQQAPTEPEALPQYSTPETEGLPPEGLPPEEELPQAAPIEPEDV